MKFVAANYWDLVGTFAAQQTREFQATLMSVDGRTLCRGKDFDATTGRLMDDGLVQLDEASRGSIVGPTAFGRLSGQPAYDQTTTRETKSTVYDQHTSAGGQP